jgi:hypothetical protein
LDTYGDATHCFVAARCTDEAAETAARREVGEIVTEREIAAVAAVGIVISIGAGKETETEIETKDLGQTPGRLTVQRSNAFARND